MKFSLSTNWCNRRIEDGRAIAEKAMALGFDELELGFHTTLPQVAGFKAMREQIPIGSVHAFCPVPLSAPQGYPELYLLANLDEEGARLARIHVTRNVEFAADMGADTVVLHAGRVHCGSCWDRFLVRFGDRFIDEKKRRVVRGRKLVDSFKRELETLVPVLEKHCVVLALENLPYLEGFPAEWEIGDLVGEWVRPWFDTGHDFVRQDHGWKTLAATSASSPFLDPVGLHLSDSLGDDDHLPPGEGKVDFAALKEMARRARHLVFEPSPNVEEDALRAGLDHLKSLWG